MSVVDKFNEHFVKALILILMAPSVSAQELATFEVKTAGSGVAVPVSVALQGITDLPEPSLVLHRVEGKKRIAIPFQVADRVLVWQLDGGESNPRYSLSVRKKGDAKTDQLVISKDNGALTIRLGNKNLLRYQFGTMMPPQGADPIFQRSGFIHPLWSPSGRILTRIQPPDHYHHYGLWNPWTHVLYDGDTIDFWNLYKKQGTVQFKDFVSTLEGKVFVEYSALHHHVVFRKRGEETVIREVQTIRVYAPRSAGYYVADITISLKAPQKEVRLLEYRYGGLGWRATEQWTKDNSRVMTSEGKTRKDADGSLARWCLAEGSVDGGVAGIVLMSNPSNYNHPEPLRVWPENSNNNRGDMFVNFSPTKNTDWPLLPGEEYVLRYRMIVYDRHFSREMAEAAWRHFADPPEITVFAN